MTTSRPSVTAAIWGSFGRLIDRFVPAGSSGDDALGDRRARILVACALACLVWGPVYAGVYVAAGHGDFAVPMGATGAIALAVLFVIRRTGAVRLSAVALVSAYAFCLTYLAYTKGGSDNAALWWLASAPMIATVLLGARSGAAFLGVTAITYGAFYAMGIPSVEIDPLPAELSAIMRFASVFGLAALVMAITVMYQGYLSEAVAQFAHANAELRTEIEHRSQIERTLRDSEEKYRRLVENFSSGYFVYAHDANGNFTYVSPSMSDMLGYTSTEFLENFRNFITDNPINDAAAEHTGRTIEGAQQPPYGIEIYDKQGSIRCLEIVEVPLIDENGRTTGVEAIAQDITERKMAQARSEHIARHDALTNVPNRTQFEQTLSDAVATARETGDGCALLFVDLDHFKDINDALGHPTGDALIKAVAQRLTRALRGSDFLARLGGDEFAILLEADIHHPEGALRTAQRLIDKVSEPYGIDGNQVRTAASVGITLVTPDSSGAEVLMGQADLALYEAKRAGRGTYRIYTEDMDSGVRRRLGLREDLWMALERRELFVMYQPQVDIATGRIVGVEALLRWEHPERGLVSPVEFIPLAEETGQIVEIGDWVLHEACRQAMAWRRIGLEPVRMSVNLSATQFRDPAYSERVSKALEETGMDPDFLELELTESILMSSWDQVQSTLDELKKLGVQLAIDDFGTGYSSMQYLTNMPLTHLKIPREFIRNIETDMRDRAVVEGIIGLAHSLGLLAIAEGVENGEQLYLLRNSRCDLVQGYYYWKPMVADEFAEILAQGLIHMRAARAVNFDTN